MELQGIPSPANGFHHEHVAVMLQSYHHWTGRKLPIPDTNRIESARSIFTAPFVVLSHGIGDDPVFNYGNALALELFELEWDDFTRMPSRNSAETINQRQRADILQQVAQQGYCEDYSGTRISASGRRFQIQNSTLWNLLDQKGNHYGQAACFDRWEFL